MRTSELGEVHTQLWGTCITVGVSLNENLHFIEVFCSSSTEGDIIFFLFKRTLTYSIIKIRVSLSRPPLELLNEVELQRGGKEREEDEGGPHHGVRLTGNPDQ